MDTPNSKAEPGSPADAAAARLLETVRSIGPVAVAYSGGTDSALVLAAAVKALGAENVLAVTAVSESLAAGELAAAADFAGNLRVRHLTPRTRELRSPGYRANGPDRCYFCKSEVLDTIRAAADKLGFREVATGTNADDARDPFRPGIRAGREREVHTPLRDAGMSKGAVRRVARHWDLPIWDKPAQPCLASRVRYGLEVTGHRLARIDRAEQALHAYLAEEGVKVENLRVRDLGDTVRVEVDSPCRAGHRAARSRRHRHGGRVRRSAAQRRRLPLRSPQSRTARGSVRPRPD